MVVSSQLVLMKNAEWRATQMMTENFVTLVANISEMMIAVALKKMTTLPSCEYITLRYCT